MAGDDGGEPRGHRPAEAELAAIARPPGRGVGSLAPHRPLPGPRAAAPSRKPSRRRPRSTSSEPCGDLRWTARPEWTDGVVHYDLPTGDDIAVYLHRTVTVEAPQTITC